MRLHRLLLVISVFLLSIGLLAAQDDPPPFATNTPAAAPLFATNTPHPTPVQPPGAPFDRYALRLWDERALSSLLLEQVNRLLPGDSDRRLAIRLLQRELAARFPGAPKDTALREQIIRAMLDAPRGSADMRPLVRPYVESALNQTRPPLDSMSSLEYGGFSITIMPADLDGDNRADAVLQTRYPAVVGNPAEIRYQDFTFLRLDESGIYRVLDSNPPLPAAPLDDLRDLTLERLSDLNQDGVYELALSLERGGVNRELLIYGWRNNAVTNLVQPGQRILYGELPDWPLSGDWLLAREYQAASPAWNCLEERDVRWTWRANFFRPQQDEGGSFTFQSSLACLLYGAEPFFEQPAADAISEIESMLPTAEAEDAATVQRARLTVAMLQVLNGEPGVALETVRQLQAEALPGTWLAEQTAAFLDAAALPNLTPVQLCAALEAASDYSACNVDQVLARLLAEQPLSRDESIEAQLARLGITVRDTFVISEVGKVDRQAVRFDLAGDRWWAFAPVQRDTYTAERIAPLPGFEPVTPLPPLVEPPPAAVEAMLSGDLAESLNVLSNAIRDNSGVPLASSSRFMQALSYDLLGDRNAARRAYFALWSDDPMSVWGELAAAHLEQR